MVLFLAPNEMDLSVTKAILEILALTSGLSNQLRQECCNAHWLLGGANSTCHSFASMWSGRFPMSLPWCTVDASTLKVDAVASRIPTWKGKLMNTTGRAILVHMCIMVCLSPLSIESIDKLWRAFGVN